MPGFLKNRRTRISVGNYGEALLGSKSQSISLVWVLKCYVEGVDKLIDVKTTLHCQGQIFWGNLELTTVEYILFLWYLTFIFIFLLCVVFGKDQ